MNAPTTGFLTAECATYDGSGILPENHGMGLTEWLGCPDCHGTGWTVHEETPAISIGHLGLWASEMSMDWSDWEDDFYSGKADGHNGILEDLVRFVNDEFQEAR